MTDERTRPALRLFAAWINEQMTRRRLGKNELAELLGLSQSSVSEYTRGLRAPRLKTVRRLADAFDVPTEEILALLPTEESPAVLARYGSVSGPPASVADWMRDPDLRVLFYGITTDLTQEELDSIKPILWKEYLRVMARRGERVEGSADAGPGGPA